MSEPTEIDFSSADAGNAPPAGADERSSLNDATGQAAALIASEGLSNGDRAALRRISPDAPFTPALWNVLHRLGQHETPGPWRQETWERRWATLLMGLAFCAEPGQSLHEYRVPLGRALLEAGWSELRFVRLLRSDGEGLEVELRRVAQYLASKSQPANWADAMRLLFYQHGDAAGDIRLSIARDYYSARYQREQEEPNAS